MLTPENRMKGMRNLAGILESTIAIIRGTIANLELDADCGPDFNGEFRRSEFGVYEVALHDFSNTAEYPDGFYLLETDRNDERCLVRLYTPIEPKVRGVGFGIWDGGGFMPLAELVRDARLTRVVFMTRGGASC